MVKSHKLLESNSPTEERFGSTRAFPARSDTLSSHPAYLSICILAGGTARLVELSYQECHRCR